MRFRLPPSRLCLALAATFLLAWALSAPSGAMAEDFVWPGQDLSWTDYDSYEQFFDKVLSPKTSTSDNKINVLDDLPYLTIGGFYLSDEDESIGQVTNNSIVISGFKRLNVYSISGGGGWIRDKSVGKAVDGDLIVNNNSVLISNAVVGKNSEILND
ncbi:MAG: hypothetical protein LBL95_03855, partial [Deltaproteobacteria bacterium]|nr:hypothetical protein [Deltaproteobacteria bacterium]